MALPKMDVPIGVVRMGSVRARAVLSARDRRQRDRRAPRFAIAAQRGDSPMARQPCRKPVDGDAGQIRGRAVNARRHAGATAERRTARVQNGDVNSARQRDRGASLPTSRSTFVRRQPGDRSTLSSDLRAAVRRGAIATPTGLGLDAVTERRQPPGRGAGVLPIRVDVPRPASRTSSSSRWSSAQSDVTLGTSELTSTRQRLAFTERLRAIPSSRARRLIVPGAARAARRHARRAGAGMPAGHHRSAARQLPGAVGGAAEHPRLPAAQHAGDRSSTRCRRRSSRPSTCTAIRATSLTPTRSTGSSR